MRCWRSPGRRNEAAIPAKIEGVDRPNGESETMSRVQHSKPSRRLGWAAAALVLFALPTAAQAQGFFFLFGSPSPYEIERQLAASGYVAHRPADDARRRLSRRRRRPRRGAGAAGHRRPERAHRRALSRSRRSLARGRRAAAVGMGRRPALVERAASARSDRPRRRAAGRLRAAAGPTSSRRRRPTRPSPSRRPPRPSRSRRPSRRRSPT